MNAVLLIERTPLGPGFAETWTLNAPATRNALTDEMVAALGAACQRASADAALRVVVLRGAGGHFCAGGSLGHFASAIGQPHTSGSDPLVAMNRTYGQLLQALCALPQVLIVAVQGAAMGGGVGLVCCADHVLAAPDAQFATPEVTLGIVPAQIAPFVVRRLGAARARDWLLSGARWGAEQARAAGLVNAVASDDFDTDLLQQLKRFAQAAPAAAAETKQLLALLDAPLDSVLNTAAQAFARSLRGSEAPQGLKAFAARQPAPWVPAEGGAA
ncbi:MAG: enoyl-CoA hydratase/isomerase family protein [Pseudomonadota bacterium]|nr:enoyl-CoA hydratase/isomerase family protein [Pseudomonadota bacterium]